MNNQLDACSERVHQLSQGGAVAAHLVHTQEVAGASPAPATISQVAVTSHEPDAPQLKRGTIAPGSALIFSSVDWREVGVLAVLFVSPSAVVFSILYLVVQS